MRPQTKPVVRAKTLKREPPATRQISPSGCSDDGTFFYIPGKRGKLSSSSSAVSRSPKQT